VISRTKETPAAPWLQTGITAFLETSGTIENARVIAAHESPRTTKFYDRTGDETTLDEVDRVVI
jgi:integrase/recombinase XerD